MEKKEIFSDSLKFVLEEMCRIVGADYNSIDFSEDRWYIKYEWTTQECKQFQKWMSDYLYNNAKARREIMHYPSKRKKSINELCEWFTFQYGWRYCNDEKNAPIV